MMGSSVRVAFQVEIPDVIARFIRGRGGGVWRGLTNVRPFVFETDV
jgi:hypothetical protein